MKQGGHETSQWAKILGTSRVVRSGIQVTQLLGLICPSYPKQQGMVRLSTSLPLYSASFLHIRNQRFQKKTFPKNTQHTKKNLPNVISSRCPYKYITNVFSQSTRNAGSGHIHSTPNSPRFKRKNNLLGPPNKFHILHVRNLHQKMAKTVKSFGSNLCPRLTS